MKTFLTLAAIATFSNGVELEKTNADLVNM
jgi:hypothetical protein